MVATCCAFGCTNRYTKGNPRTFHSFPTDVIRRKDWIQNVNRANWQPTKHTRICSDHFTRDSFVVRPDATVGDRRLLKSGAVPTIFVNFRLKSRKQRRLPKKQTFQEVFETEAKSSLEPEATSSLEPEAASSLETEAASSLETEAASSLETEATSSLGTEAKSSLETEATSSLETEATSSLETEATPSFNTKATSSLETEAASSPETGATSSLETEAKSSLETGETSLLETKATPPFNTKATSSLKTLVRLLETDTSSLETEATSLPKTKPTRSTHTQTDHDFLIKEMKRKEAEVIKLNKKLQAMRMQVCRRNKKIKSIKLKLNSLKDKKIVIKNDFKMLSERFSGMKLEILKNEFKNCSKSSACRYSHLMKEFSIALHFHSPAAYKFLRHSLCLPHYNKIRKWTSPSCVNPGFIKDTTVTVDKSDKSY